MSVKCQREKDGESTIFSNKFPRMEAHLFLEFLVLLDVFAARDSNLDQDDLVDQVRMLFEEMVESFKFLDNPFGIV